jgi:hypothetical protein
LERVRRQTLEYTTDVVDDWDSEAVGSLPSTVFSVNGPLDVV